jgi:hypothetical protein
MPPGRCLGRGPAILRPMTRSRAALVASFALLASLALAGCDLRDHERTAGDAGQEAPAGAPDATEEDSDKRTISVAPIALGPLSTRDEPARASFADQIADRLNFAVKDVEASAARALPDADARDWQSGPVPAASDANLVVLTRVSEIVPSPKGGIDAVVEMRVIDPSDPKAPPVFFKKARGHAESGDAAIAGAGSPEGAAAWDACSTLVGAVAAVLAADPDQTVSVAIDSEPAHAQVEVDGRDAGATPCQLDLPAKAVAVRITHDGCQPWERTLTPVAGMRIQPRLAALGAPAAPPAGAGASSSASASATAAGGGEAPPKPAPQPTRSTIDPTMSPPTPPQLVVPEGK